MRFMDITATVLVSLGIILLLFTRCASEQYEQEIIVETKILTNEVVVPVVSQELLPVYIDVPHIIEQEVPVMVESEIPVFIPQDHYILQEVPVYIDKPYRVDNYHYYFSEREKETTTVREVPYVVEKEVKETYFILPASTPTPIIIPTPTITPIPTPTPTSTPEPVDDYVSGGLCLPCLGIYPTKTLTPEPTATPTATPTPISIPTATLTPTLTPRPTAIPIVTSTPIPEPTATPVPPTVTPRPSTGGGYIRPTATPVSRDCPDIIGTHSHNSVDGTSHGHIVLGNLPYDGNYIPHMHVITWDGEYCNTQYTRRTN